MERRSESRIMCADMVDVQWKDQNGKSNRATALLEDISASGACLQLEAAIPLGVEVRWIWPKQEFIGRVRYCDYREIGYFAGVEFNGNTKWSRKRYKPRHLLDPSTLLKWGRPPGLPGE